MEMPTPNLPKAADEDNLSVWDVFNVLSLDVVTALRALLSIDEQIIRTHTFHTAPKDFALSTALDEVEKTSMTLMRLQDLLADSDDEKTEAENAGHSIHRTSLEMLTEEIRFRGRRLSELLAQLVLFLDTNEEIFFRHFLLVRHQDGGHRLNSDLNEFFAHPSQWVALGLADSAGEIRALELKLDIQRAWYLESRVLLDQTKSTRRLATARTQFVHAIPRMRDVERLVMGSTYGDAFGQPSNSIHYAVGAIVSRLSEQTVRAEGGRLALLGFCVIQRCRELLEVPVDGPGTKIEKFLKENTNAGRLHDLLNYGPQIDVGDYVVVWGFLGHVTEDSISKYGYRCLRIELLAERPRPDLEENWFRPRDVKLLFRSAKIRECVAKLVGRPESEIDLVSMRDSVLEAWNAGLREKCRSGAH